MTVCIECGEVAKEGYWNTRDWKRLTVAIEIGEQKYERSGIACLKCCKKWRDGARWTARAEEGREK